MSVRTTADDALDKARDHVGHAVKALSEIVVDECWGHDEYSDEFIAEICSAFAALMTVRAKIGARS